MFGVPVAVKNFLRVAVPASVVVVGKVATWVLVSHVGLAVDGELDFVPPCSSM